MILVNTDKPDILLTAEGTYPFVKGGVSSWIHSLISELQEFKFGVIFLGSRPEEYGDIKYDLPENLVYLSTYYLFDNQEKVNPKIIRTNYHKLRKVIKLHSLFRREKNKTFTNLLEYLEEIKEEEFLYSKWAWRFITKNYFGKAIDLPFIDYFWTLRNMHYPIWKIVKITEETCNFKLIHSPSTGYAGFLASLLKLKKNKPFILTEHGIYIRERKIDIMNASWIRNTEFFFQKEIGELDYFKKIWINFFLSIGQLSYETADKIISLFKDARKAQIKFGAPKEKTEIIANGVKVEIFKECRKKRKENIPPIIALIGRVVPIKDIKTFIKAMRIVINKIPESEGWIVGPTDEDPEYFKECLKLREALKLENNVKFLGFQNLKDIFPQIGLTTLTSISEGMPLVILESFAAGVPVVATDVGSCRQLIYGELNEEDKKIGKAGEVCKVASPGEIAEAYIKLLLDRNLWYKSQQAAIKRVEKFYKFEDFINKYRNIYRNLKNGRNSI